MSVLTRRILVLASFCVVLSLPAHTVFAAQQIAAQLKYHMSEYQGICGGEGFLSEFAASMLACMNAIPPPPEAIYRDNYRNMRENPNIFDPNPILVDSDNRVTGLPQTGTLPGSRFVICPDGYRYSGIFFTCRFDLSLPVIVKTLGQPNVCVGNPCDVSTGNKYLVETDYVGPGPFPIIFRRVYNGSTQVPPGRIGANWRHSYERQITLWTNQGASSAYVNRADGKVLIFTLTSGVWSADEDIPDQLIRLLDPQGHPTGWQFVDSDNDGVEIYDNNGWLLFTTNRAGLTQTLTYDASGRLQGVTDPFGRSLLFLYDGSNRIGAVIDPGNDSYTFTYDANNDLSAVTYPGAVTRSYLYNEPAYTQGFDHPHALTGVIDENGQRFASYDYNGNRQVSISEHAGGAERVSLSYGAASTSVTSAFNSVNDYNFTLQLGVKRLVSIGGPACPTCGPASSSYDSNGFPASRTDWNGNRTNYAYDARGLEISRTEGLTSAGAITLATRTIETEWHATFRLPTQITEKDGGGTVLRTTSMSYDDTSGNLLTRTITAVASTRTWSYTYNANGSVLTMDGPRTDVADLTTYTYYRNDDPDLGKRGNVATITNAAGHVTQITAYNAHGQPLTIMDANGLTTTLAYEARQRLTSRNVGGETTTHVYDGVGQLTKVILPDSSFLSSSYDAAHRLTQIADNLRNRIAYTLDAMGNRTKEQVSDPLNSLAQTRSRVYSNLNRLDQEIGAQSQTTSYGYDNQGNVTSIDGPLAGTVDLTTNAYDALNRLIRVTDPHTGQVNYGYNALDQLTSVSDPSALTTSYVYDGLNNLNQHVSPDTGSTVNTYDAAGNILTQADAKGQVTRYAYDALNRVTSIIYQGGVTHTYQYDQGVNGKGRLTQIAEPNSTTQYVYDQKGRLITETRTINAVNYTTRYAYDGFGRMTGMTYPSGRQVTYTLDALGRIQQLATTQAVVSSVVYRPFGPARGFTFGNNEMYSRGFDQDGRIASYTLAAQTFGLGYDAASRVGLIGDVGNPASGTIYTYDNLDRLTHAALPGTAFTYSYDAVGNRLSKTVGASTDTYAYSATSNRLASVTRGAGPLRNYVHDANGSVTADGINTYAYDVRGRSTQAVSAIGATRYQINSLGQRIAKVLPGATGGGGGQTLFSDTFPGPDGRPIDDQADHLWKGHGPKHVVARVRGGEAEIARQRHIRTAAAFPLGPEGLVLTVKLVRGTVALTNAGRAHDGVAVGYDGQRLVVVTRARDDDGDADDDDDVHVKRPFKLAVPGSVLNVQIELKPGGARVRISAGAQTLDTGELSLPGVRQGERYRIRLGSARQRHRALTGRFDDVALRTGGRSTATSSTMHYVYDAQGRLIGEYTGQGALVREYAYLGDSPVGLFEPDGAVFFVHTDHLNTPRLITNSSGQAVWRWDNTDPFGGNVPDENPSGLGTFAYNLRFPGQYFDKETNLHYNYFRDYDPGIGRYVHADPLGIVTTATPTTPTRLNHLYAYVDNNPLWAIDAKGLAQAQCVVAPGTRCRSFADCHYSDGGRGLYCRDGLPRYYRCTYYSWCFPFLWGTELDRCTPAVGDLRG